MRVSEIVKILDAQIITGEDLLDHVIETACGADLMSDVLAFAKEKPALLTGLLNPQVIRTVDMLDGRCIIFVRGKQPDGAMIELAIERKMVLLATKLDMYSACGKLYNAGLVPVM